MRPDWLLTSISKPVNWVCTSRDLHRLLGLCIMKIYDLEMNNGNSANNVTILLHNLPVFLIQVAWLIQSIYYANVSTVLCEIRTIRVLNETNSFEWIIKLSAFEISGRFKGRKSNPLTYTFSRVLIVGNILIDRISIFKITEYRFFFSRLGIGNLGSSPQPPHLSALLCH